MSQARTTARACGACRTTRLSASVISLWESGGRQGIYDIRQLLQFADAVGIPRLALLPAILGHPVAVSDLLADASAELITALAEAASHG
jgi:hypothetical protein